MFYGLNAWFLATLVMGALWWVAGASVPSWRKLAPLEGAQAYVSAWSRGGPALAALSLVAGGLGVAAAFSDNDVKWAIGAACMLGAIIYTIIFMGAPGHRLRDLAQQRDAAAAEAEVASLLDA
ncbi:MAG: hypothetical protein AAF909_12765, partial [Pseudomonadota bacterium]